MAGMGPAPKDPSRRALRNKDTVPQTLPRWEQAEAPELPDFRVERDGELVEFVRPERTRERWQMWIDSPQADHFGSSDWQYLLDTALIHARPWRGELSAAAELRLRMVFTEADGADEDRGASGGPSARERYGQLRSLPSRETGTTEPR